MSALRDRYLRLSATARGAIVVSAAVIAIVITFGLWFVAGPGPTDFAGGSGVALADYHGADPSGVPPTLAHADQIKRGEYLTRAADCTACHTAPAGEPYAGGYAFTLPFGTIYSPNITPDRETGIGNWSDADFLNAIHKGIDNEGGRLYP